jgi:tRNA (cmo5U34)-methyltransferase
LIKWAYNGMVEGGVLVVTEKVLTTNTHMNRFFIDFYHDFKRRNKYSEEEISRKGKPLRTCLFPTELMRAIKCYDATVLTSSRYFFNGTTLSDSFA